MDAQQIQGIIVPIGFLLMFYFFIIRPQKKREKEIQDMRSNLKTGDKIITIGGIIGEIVVLKEDLVTIETSTNKTRIDLTKWAIGSVLDSKLEN